MVRLILLLAGILILELSCGRSAEVPAASTKSAAGKSNQVFEVKGVIKELKPDGKTAEIRHEAITNYMPAMVMSFEAKEPKELVGLKAGDQVKFRMTVTEDDFWIDQIQKLTVGNPNQLPSKAGVFHFSRDLEPLRSKCVRFGGEAGNEDTAVRGERKPGHASGRRRHRN